MLENKYHKDFKINGVSFNSIESILVYSKTLSKDISSFLASWFDERDHIIVRTSGSTGDPKAIKLRKNFMINSAVATGNYFNLPAKTNAILCLSVNFIAGKMMLVRAIVLGWNLDTVEPSSNPIDNIKNEYDFCAMVPMQLNNSLQKLNLINKLIVGGGAISKSLLDKITNIKSQIFATYGMTETITHIAVKQVSGSKISDSKYTVMPNVEIETDHRGCLIIKAKKISDRQIITNDLVRIISDKKFEWLGRIDTIVNSGGIKLIPEQIETKLSPYISMRFFITGIKDNVLGEKLVLIIEGLPYELNDKVFKNLSKLETPKNIYFVANFIETENNKIDRNKSKKYILK